MNMYSNDSSLRGERPIQESEYTPPNLAEYLSQIIFVVTPQGGGEYFNPYWQKYTGQDQEGSLERGWMGAFHGEDVEEFLRQLRGATLDQSWECAARIRDAEGHYRHHLCHCSILSREPGPGVRVLVSCSGAPDRKDAISQQETLLGFCLRTHDEEKRKVAHVLHDSAGQYLIALQMKLEGLQRWSIGSMGHKNATVEECRELVKRCLRDIRNTSYLLYPPLLDDLGLEPAVHLHVNGFMERTKIRVELDVEPNLGRLDRHLEIALFRVVQEGLATVHAESAASEIQIKIGAAATSVFVEVVGRGAAQGLPAHVAASRRGSAIVVTLLRQRILEIGGLFEIGSLADGMVLRVAVPRKELVAQAGD